MDVVVSLIISVQTDHHALEWLNQLKDSNYSLLRGSLALQPFQFKVIHRAGQSNGNTNALSCMESHESNTVWLEEGGVSRTTCLTYVYMLELCCRLSSVSIINVLLILITWIIITILKVLLKRVRGTISATRYMYAQLKNRWYSSTEQDNIIIKYIPVSEAYTFLWSYYFSLIWILMWCHQWCV